MTLSAPVVPDTRAEEHWTAVLRAGGSTAIPRWAPEPSPGTAVHRETVPAEVVRAVGELAAAEDVPPGAILLAAHASVLTALSGDTDVVTGHPSGDAVLPLPVPAGDLTWRELVRVSAAALRDAVAYAGTDVDGLADRLGVSGPEFDTVLDLASSDVDPRHALTVRGVPDVPVLELVHRTDVLDADAAARIAGYHLAALAAATARPDEPHRAASLVGPDEVHHQVHDLAGPARVLPDRRVHEIVAERARRHPDAVVAVAGNRVWTYRELDERVNRLARALLARGLGREDVVAVVTERNLEWLASVLAVFTAGGVYLPIEPHFPADRIADVLSRSGARIALTEPGSTDTLDRALSELDGITRLTVDEAWDSESDSTNPGVEVGPDQLAYIYFTSGSTGRPKGAMCEHAGMLNHLLAKIDDLGIGEGTVVAQTAPQCFDISLWQLVAAPMTGGRTVLVAQDEILDVRRFVDTVESAGVEVVQLVPSYLEVVLAHLDAEPRALPRLRRVSATGEALKFGLVERWFGAYPHVALVNAYGLTETSDDTNHAVLHAAPSDGRVPLGPPIPGVHVYVVDADLRPVPLGAPGEIVFSGVCVGRGYVNDPDRTAAAFVPDPLRPGMRLYRSGDHGRWLPDGSLGFLGRRDTQVKIRGFRIEIGEVENALLRVPGVRDAAVVVAERGAGERDLVAFWSGADTVDSAVLREELGKTLPGYMVPVAFHRADALPLTANGKIDRKELAARAAVAATPSDVDSAGDAPSGAAEERVAAAFASVLGVDGVRRSDSFFALGGTSLSAVKLVIALKRAVTLPDVVANPVLSDLAALLDRH